MTDPNSRPCPCAQVLIPADSPPDTCPVCDQSLVPNLRERRVQALNPKGTR